MISLYRFSLKNKKKGWWEILYLRVILRDVGHSQTVPTHIYEDNFVSIDMSTNPVRRKSSRHIDIRVHFFRELCVLVLCD